MRNAAICAVLICLLIPEISAAQTPPTSSVRVAHAILKAGQAQTVTVMARDLSGQPWAGASVIVVVSYGSAKRTYHLRRTDASGRTSVTFHAPRGLQRANATITVTLTDGVVTMSLAAAFALGTGKQPSASVKPTHPSSSGHTQPPGLTIAARMLPASVIAPEPIWVVASVRTPAGIAGPSAKVSAHVGFQEGAVDVTGTTDSDGVATIQVDTSHVAGRETVRVSVTGASGALKGTGNASFSVDRLAPTSTSTPTLTLTPTTIPTLTATPTFVPTATSVPTWTPTTTPLPTLVPTPTPTSTFTPTPSATDVPTSTAVPTSTSTALPTSTPTPTATSTPVPNCPGSQDACMQAMLSIINATRTQAGLRGLNLSMTQSNGTGSCVGSIGHSKAMAASNSIWHQNADYPAASWPNNICVPWSATAENVGMGSSGNELTDLNTVHNEMMAEPHFPGCTGNHACNILSTQYNVIGIGIYVSGGATWVTEDFTN